MPDVLGWRAKLAVLGPSTNTVVQPDFEDLRPAGVTNHYRSIFTPNLNAVSNETFMAGTSLIGANVMGAVDHAMTMQPTYLVMGMSAVTFIGGVKGAEAFEQSIKERTGLGISMGSAAVQAALRAYGGIRRVAFLSPYFPAANAHVRQYLTEIGFDVVRDLCLQCPSWLGIAEVEPATLRAKLIELDGDDVDAIVQVGTNLSMIRLAAAAEVWLGKPVIAINTATYWHALRTLGIADKKVGFGALMEKF
jgi:maleate isomerase